MKTSFYGLSGITFLLSGMFCYMLTHGESPYMFAIPIAIGWTLLHQSEGSTTSPVGKTTVAIFLSILTYVLVAPTILSWLVDHLDNQIPGTEWLLTWSLRITAAGMIIGGIIMLGATAICSLRDAMRSDNHCFI